MKLVEEMSAALDRLQPSGRLLVAVSGGADSVAALRLAHAAGRDVTAAHFDHRLRVVSGADVEFVRLLSAELGVELISGAANVAEIAVERGWNLEDAARRLRYEFLHRSAKSSGATGVVVAHTRDDQAETFLMQLLRGSAYPAGMSERRGLVIRPLLGVPRAGLREYLSALGQTWREDETNLDTSRTRSWIRHELLPTVAGRYPSVAKSLSNTATVLGDAEKAIEAVAAQLLGDEQFMVANLAAVPVAVQRTALAGLLERADASPNFELLETIRDAVALAAGDDERGPWRVSLGSDRFVRVAYGLVEVVSRGERILEAPRLIASIEDWQAVLAELAGHDLSDHDLPSPELVAELLDDRARRLVLRHRMPGDRVGLSAGSKSLSDLLIDRKVPAEQRDSVFVLALDSEGGAASEVVWVEGQGWFGNALATEAGGTKSGDARLPENSRETDHRFMRLALNRAKEAGEAGELPVGAVVVKDGQVLASAGNRSEADDDPSGHAEMLALREAASVDGDWRLTGATLYVTLEPCPMCFGAVLQTRIERVVFGAANHREGALGSVMDLRSGAWKRKPKVERGILAKASGQLLSEFFARRR